jgi:hypothetical protein
MWSIARARRHHRWSLRIAEQVIEQTGKTFRLTTLRLMRIGMSPLLAMHTFRAQTLKPILTQHRDRLRGLRRVPILILHTLTIAQAGSHIEQWLLVLRRERLLRLLIWRRRWLLVWWLNQRAGRRWQRSRGRAERT